MNEKEFLRKVEGISEVKVNVRTMEYSREEETFKSRVSLVFGFILIVILGLLVNPLLFLGIVALIPFVLFWVRGEYRHSKEVEKYVLYLNKQQKSLYREYVESQVVGKVVRLYGNPISDDYHSEGARILAYGEDKQYHAYNLKILLPTILPYLEDGVYTYSPTLLELKTGGDFRYVSLLYRGLWSEVYGVRDDSIL